MVCARCIWMVRKLFQEINVEPLSVALGEVVVRAPLSPEQTSVLGATLEKYGFELLQDPQSQLVSRIKTEIIALVRDTHGERNENVSQYLSRVLLQDYSALSSLFSKVEGITIEHFLIAQRIERAKELLAYNEMTLNEIAWELGYSSVAHLSSQFKKVTGLTPSHFKSIGHQKRKPLDEV